MSREYKKQMLLKREKDGKVEIFRVLDVLENILVINCVKRSMPVWKTTEELSEYVEMEEQKEEKILSPKQEQEANRIYNIISPVIPFISNESLRTDSIKEVAKRYDVSEQFVRKYLSIYLAANNISSLAPKTRNEGRELTRDEKNIRKSLNKWYYTTKKRTLKNCYTLMLENYYCDEKGKLLEEYPSYYQFRYFYRRYNKPSTEMISRNTLSYYQRNQRPLVGDGVQGFAGTIGMGMLDATVCDIYLVNESGELVGRPIFTSCVDAFTGLVCGYALSWEGGIYSLRDLMLNVITDKVEHCKSFGINITEEQWPSHQMPLKLVTDQGSEYKGFTFGEYGSYYVYPDNAEAEKEHYSGGSIFNEKIESVLDVEVEYDTGKIAHNKSMRVAFNDMDHSAFGEIKNESIESESIKLTGYWEKHTLLISPDTGEDDGNTDKGYRTINPIGTQMVEFLNFDIDSYVDGSWSISYKVEDGERIAINGWKYEEPHNLDNMYQRPAIALEMQIGMDTNIKEFQQEYVPFFIRCFYGLMIDFGEWKYNTAGIEGIKKLQKKYRELCDRVFISDAEGDSLWERYCRVHEISDESEDVIKCIRKNCKKNAETGAKWLKELDVDTSPHTIEMLDGLLGAEFDAMLYKDVNLKKCANCGDYFIANKSDAQFCKKKYTLESYYLRKEDMDKEKEADRRYKLGIEDDTLKDRIVMPTVSFCDDSVHMIKQFNKKWGEHPILYASLREKNRLRHFIEANLSDLHELKLVYKLGDSDSGPLAKAIKVNQESYVVKYDEALKESKEKADEVLQEYDNHLIEAVNCFIKENAPKSKLDFTRKKAYKE